MHFLLKYNILQNGNGGVRNCGGVALAYGPDGPNGPNGQDGRATVYPVGLHAAVWYGAERKCAAGVQ